MAGREPEIPSAAEAVVHAPDAFAASLPRRPDAELPFDLARHAGDVPVIFDATFYVHRLQNKLPREVIDFAAARPSLHSAVALEEIAISFGLLDPAHAQTATNRAALLSVLRSVPAANLVAPSPAAWIEAGVVAGILARTQLGLARSKQGLSPAEVCCQTGKRRRLLNDALIFLSARESGAVLVTGNVADMDLMLRFRPDARLLLYRPS